MKKGKIRARKIQPDTGLFGPDELETIKSFAILSGSYFNAAETLRKLAWEGQESKAFPHSNLTIPAIIMFATSLEVFINEISDKELADLTLCKEKVCKFVCQHLPSVILVECDWYQNTLALIVLRNELVHYTPKMRERTSAPKNVAEAMKKSKIKLLAQASYTMNLSNPVFADWACTCVRKFGEEVSKNWYPSHNYLMTHEEYHKVLEALPKS